MMSGPTVRSNTSKVIAYMIGIDLDESAKQQLLEQILRLGKWPRYAATRDRDLNALPTNDT